MTLNSVKLNDKVVFGADKLVIMAGPCVIESEEIVMKTAEDLKKYTTELDLPFVFKASYDKANRTSIESYRGPGIEEGLKILQKVKDELELPIVTDIHNPSEADMTAEVADVIQIPAFLSRQTDLLVAAAKTGKIVNIKKGQFLSPTQMKNSAGKVKASGNNNVLLTERGSFFGYGNLVVDMRAISIMKELGCPVVFDATHSVQLPGGAGSSSSGERKFVPTLAKSAVAAGVDALFFEIHPCPDEALCDGANMIALDESFELFKKCKEIFEVVRN